MKTTLVISLLLLTVFSYFLIRNYQRLANPRIETIMTDWIVIQDPFENQLKSKIYEFQNMQKMKYHRLRETIFAQSCLSGKIDYMLNEIEGDLIESSSEIKDLIVEHQRSIPLRETEIVQVVYRGKEMKLRPGSTVEIGNEDDGSWLDYIAPIGVLITSISTIITLFIQLSRNRNEKRLLQLTVAEQEQKLKDLESE